MRAIVQDRYGPPRAVLAPRELPEPRAGAGEVRVRVVAAGIHAGDAHLVAGTPLLVRAMGYGLLRPKRAVPGTDVAGVVDALGDGVTEFGVGDEVLGFVRGAFAELAVAKASALARKPAGLAWERAAVVPTSGVTAVQALRAGAVGAGSRVLVTGAGGGVGTFAVQLAVAAGADVTGLCSAAKVDLVRSLGAARVVDAARDPDLGSEYDAIVDTGGSRPLDALRRMLVRGGRLVIVGGEGGSRLLGPVTRLLGAAVRSPFVPQRLIGLMASDDGDDLRALAAQVATGRTTPVVDRVWPLEDAAEALAYVGQGRARGKVALRIARN